MDKLKELRAQRKKLGTEAKALLDFADADSGRGLTDEEQKTFDGLHAQIEAMAQPIENLEKQTALQAHLAAPSGSPMPARDMPAGADGIADPAVALKTIPAEPKRPVWSSMGEFLHSVYLSGIDAGTDPRLRMEAQTGANEGIASDGGFLVNTDMASGILKRVYEVGEVSRRTRNVPISPGSNGIKLNGLAETSRADGARFGGVKAYWIAEAGTKQASQPHWRQMELSLRKLCCLFYATDELLQDAAAIESEVNEYVPQELNFRLEDAIIEGLGVGQPLGIMNSGCLITVAAEAAQPITTIWSQNIVNMWARLWARSQQNAVWFINQDCFPQLYQMGIVVGVGGAPIYQPPGGLSASPYSTILGRPVIPIEYCSTLGVVGDIILADMSQYVTITKGGIAQASSIHVKFYNDESVFRWVMRVDGQPTWAAPLTPFKGAANTQSPFVTLAGRP